MKHKHYEMIVAKAANMELTTLVKFGKEWMISAPHTVGEIISFDSRYEYFLCLPQHKEACLHYLNGGDVLVKSNFVPSWATVTHGQSWGKDVGWMCEDAQYRIKPKKEKRWILECNGTLLTTRLFTSEGAAKLWIEEFDRADEGVSAIEIEVTTK
ncbi:hypothetical protein NVP1223O_38 [Vibrio phage 1.223.O._10N.261.48.A9]|nr:hypothetical protein NVP1223O_38 [Vibrio phage 1.223.O._10N.261.48.A9]